MSDHLRNRFPLADTSTVYMSGKGVYNLHTLAARIYALGFTEGIQVEGYRKNEQRQRIRDEAKEQT